MNIRCLLILSLIVNIALPRPEISLSHDAGDSPVMIGQSVTLRCTVSSRFAARTNLSVIFLQNNTMQSENCNAYHNDKYEVICEPNEQRSNGPTRTYLFHIKSVSWTDRGKWTCLLSGSSSDIFLDVHVPPKMAPIQVTKIALPNIRPLSPSRGSDVLSDINSGVDLNSHSPQIFGLGTRTNPYDLRSGAELHLTCQTECGYPQTLPEWTVNNMSDLEPRKIESSRNVVTKTCDPRPQTRNMAKSTIALKVQCDSYHLSGINKLRCAITGTNDPAASKHIYILCRGGEIPMALTGGEIIGLGVAAIALFSLLITGCVLLRNRSKASTLLTTNHNRGELV